MANNIRQNIDVTATDSTTRGFRSVEKKLTRLDRFFSRIQTTLLGFVGLNIATNLVRDFTTISDVAVDLNAKMKLVTTSVDDHKRAQAELVDISLRTGSSLEANTVLFTRMARPVRSLGFALQDTLKVTKLVTQGLRISGASQQESASVIRQLSQAFASGVLRGEEFNALMENGGRIAIALADGLGVGIGELRAMSKEGELSSRKVITALNKQAEAIDRENARLPLTISRSFENIKTQFLDFQTQNLKFNEDVANTINSVAKNMDTILQVAVKGLEIALVTLTVLGAKRLKQKADDLIKSKLIARQEAIAAAQAARDLTSRTALESRLHLAKTTNALKEASLDRAKLQRSVRLYAAELKLLQLRIQEAAQQRLANVARLKYIADDNLRAQAIAKIRVAYTAEQATVARLTATKAKLSQAQIALSTATKAETLAVIQNTTAQAANVTATNALTASKTLGTTRFSRFANAIGLATTSTGKFTLGLGKASVAGKPLAGIFTRILAFLPRLASGLLGLPGLIALVAVEVGSSFIDMGVAWKSLLVALQTVGARIKFVLKLLSTPFSMAEHIEDLRKDLNAIDQDFQDWSDRRIADEAAVAEGFVDARQQEAAARQEAQRKEIEAYSQIDKAAKKSLELRADSHKELLKFQQAIIDSEKALLKTRIDEIEAAASREKLQLATLISNREDYAIVAAEVDRRAEEASAQATIESTRTRIAQWQKYYTDRMSAAGITSKEESVLRVESLSKEKELHGNLLTELRKHLSNQLSNYEGYRKQVQDIYDSINELQKEAAELEKSRNAATLSDFELAANERQRISEIDDKLRKVRQLDRVEDAELINRLQTAALKELKEITEAEQTRSEQFKKGSLDELEAINNSNAAYESYKALVSEVTVNRTELAETIQSNADAAEAEAERTNAAIQTTLDKISEIDGELKLRRQLLIDIDASKVHKELDVIEKRINAIKANANIPVTISTSEVQGRQNGGKILPEIKRADGGYVPRRDKVPGSGSGDKIRALLEPGEWIIRKSAVNKLGEDFMHQVNAGVAEPIRRKSGGFVGRNEGKSKSTRTYESMIRRYTEGRELLAKASKFGLAGYGNITKGKKFEELIEVTKSLKGKDPDIIRRASYVGGDAARLLLQKKENRDTFDIASQLIDRMREIGEGKTEFEAIRGFTSKFDTRKLSFGGRNARVSGSDARAARDADNASRRGASEAAREAAHIRDLERGLGGSYTAIEAAIAAKEARDTQKFSEGGQVPGKGNSDSVPSMLTPGEYVIKKSAVQKFGAAFMEKINDLQLPDVQKFATGGLVGDAIANGATIPQQQSRESIDVTLNVGGKTATGTFEKNDATNEMLRALRESGGATT